MSKKGPIEKVCEALDELCKIIKSLESVIDGLNQRIDELENPWISVDERLPEDTQAVLAWVPNNLCYYMVTLRPNGEWSSWQGDYRYWWCEFITHWMPLPIPPEASDE